MKKQLLVLALLASSTAFAGKFTINTEHKLDDVTKNIKELKNSVDLGAEHKFGESGVTIGGNFKFENDLFKEYKDRKVSAINANIKYEMPELVKGLTSYVKANANFTGKVEKLMYPKLTGEFNLAYKKDDMKYSFDSKTVLKTAEKPFEANFTHGLKAEGKVSKLEDILLAASVRHNLKHAVYVGADAKVTFPVIKDVKFTVSDSFGIIAHGEKIKEKSKTEILGEKILLKNKNLYNEFKLGAKHTTSTYEASATTIVDYVNYDKPENKKVKAAKPKVAPAPEKKETTTNEKILAIGEKLEAKYTGIKNLHPTGSILFAGIYTFDQTQSQPQKKVVAIQKTNNPKIKGLVELNNGLAYDCHVTDSLTITPEMKTSVKFHNITEETFDLEAHLKPGVNVNYKALDSLTLKGFVGLDSKFEKDGYKATSFKGTTGLEYAW